MYCDMVPGLNWCSAHRCFPKDCPRPAATPAADPSASRPASSGSGTTTALPGGVVSGPPATFVEVTRNPLWYWAAFVAVAVERFLPLEYNGVLVDACTQRASRVRAFQSETFVRIPFASEWVGN